MRKPARAGRVTGDQLCEALNRADLSALLGTPAEHAQTASGSDSSVKPAGGTETDTPEATVDLTTYSVRLSASYDRMTVDQFARLEGQRAERKTILGRQAVLYSDQTIRIGFDLGGGNATTAPGGIARRRSCPPSPAGTGADATPDGLRPSPEGTGGRPLRWISRGAATRSGPRWRCPPGRPSRSSGRCRPG
ncbi:DUF6215 domain-containing protein [Streptomyces sp. NPDC049915]|uniref:DUF6215 domain-containing protein n=1 Tax=Streptomyces sp. NPDC049915 TaxID=3155510 RepID=UPI003416CDEB